MKFKSFTDPLSRLTLLLAAVGLSPLAIGQTIPELPPEIVSAWKANGEDALLIFRYDGTYFMAQDSDTEPGMERGTFTWNQATSAFSATTLVDTNGDAGLSHPNGVTTLSISGNTMTYTVAGEGSFTLSRVVNTASAIVGSWFAPGENFTVTFLADGTYFHTEETSDAPFAYDGMERGTYSWNPTTQILTASAITDTNGDVGLSGIREGLTAMITGNSMIIPDEDTTLELRRITQIPAPLTAENSFEVDQFSNYRQTSASPPALLPGPPDDSPFWGEAYIDGSVVGTGGTLTIAGQAPRIFVDDDGWGIAAEYSSLAALNASTAFPNGASYVFARTGGSATLSYPAGGTFPPAPMITGADDHGAWDDGENYRLGETQTLIWAPHTDYNSATLVTVLSVVDQDSGEELLYETVIQGDITSYDFSGKLTPGTAYEVQLEHVKIADSTTAGTGPFAGKLGYALYNSNTRFTMVAPEEDVYPPDFYQQPVSRLAEAGEDIILSVEADGSPAPSYQWFKDGDPLSGQTGNSLALFNFDVSKRGAYTVKASNSEGEVTSSVAWLSGPPVVDFVVVGKEIDYVQTGASTVVVNPEPLSEYYGGPYNFSANVEGQNMQLLSAPIIIPPAGTPGTPEDPFYSTLFLDSWDEPEWRYGPNANDWGDTTQTALDTRFPNGTYTFSVGGVSVPLILTGNAYPNTPQITLSGGAWINGKYAMDAANALIVTTNAFTTYGSHVDAVIDLWVNDDGVEAFRNSGETANFATYTVPANTLPTDWTTEVGAVFVSVVSKSMAIPGAYAAAFYEKSVELEVHILPKIIAQTSSQTVADGDFFLLEVDATGTPASGSYGMNYQWRKNGAILDGETESVLYLSNFQQGMTGSYTCTVSNDVGTATTQPAVLSLPDGFSDFLSDYDLDPLTTGAPGFDFDKDGVPNLIEYLFGSNPTQPGGNLPTSITKALGSSNLVFTYKRKLAAAGVIQVVEHSTNLSSTWTAAVHGQSGVTIATSLLDATTEQVTVTLPSTSPSRFVRLKASR
jgi:hypothetical protein